MARPCKNFALGLWTRGIYPFALWTLDFMFRNPQSSVGLQDFQNFPDFMNDFQDFMIFRILATSDKDLGSA